MDFNTTQLTGLKIDVISLSQDRRKRAKKGDGEMVRRIVGRKVSRDDVNCAAEFVKLGWSDREIIEEMKRRGLNIHGANEAIKRARRSIGNKIAQGIRR